MNIEGHIGFIVGELGKGGQERQLLYLLKELNNQGYYTALIIWNYEPKMRAYLEQPGVHQTKVLLLEKESRFVKLVKARKFLTSNCITSIQSFSFYLNFYVFLICLFKKLKPIGAIRNRLMMMYTSQSSLSFWLCSIFPRRKISNNRDYMRGFDSLIVKCFYADTEIVFNHLNIDNFKYSFPESYTIIRTASIGRLYPEKSIDTLILVIKELKQAGFNVKHQHAGGGPLLDSLQTLLQDNDLKDSFEFVGELEDIGSFLKDKHIVIHSSIFEGFPNVLMEAMACGKPIVSTDCGDARHLVQTRVNGFIVDVNDVDALVKSLITLIVNQKLMVSFSEAGRRLAEKNFNLTTLVDQTFQAYHKLKV
ncbi:glycosyltransferase family 4 protein [Roseivirga echinicomitans]